LYEKSVENMCENCVKYFLKNFDDKSSEIKKTLFKKYNIEKVNDNEE
jgi:hypothetical protein